MDTTGSAGNARRDDRDTAPDHEADAQVTNRALEAAEELVADRSGTDPYQHPPDAPKRALDAAGELDAAEQEVVLVWDLDEARYMQAMQAVQVAEMYHALQGSHYQGALKAESASGSTYAQGHVPVVEEAALLGKTWSKAVFELLDTTFGFQQYEELEAQMENVLDLCSAEGEDAVRALASSSPDAEDFRRVHGVAENYRRARSLYEQGLGAVLPEEQAEALRTLAAETDAFLEQHSCTVEHGWLAWAARLLQECAAATQVATEAGVQGRVSGCLVHAGLTQLTAGLPHLLTPLWGMRQRVRVHNLVVTAGQLLPSLAKLLLFGLSAHVAAADVFSAATRSKMSCFERIQARYAPGAAFCAIGDGMEERSAAAALRWPFVRICLGPPSATSPAVAAASTAELRSQPLTAFTADILLRRALGEGGSALAVRNVRKRPAVPDVD